ncbi:EF-hand domain-containing protein [Longispora fulva]|uniref:Ca2+-binding EF-hand superfamily protein n=1 Tax=Longispora fulva TaxID=619741 RepID=A0A8J7KFT1_9ACTN|nr:EF-hand domain-containing protein [Longispora fulva]MBG6136575.1 Ca2+-binding EF-hand superfamily protein [Longispora fulva]
MTSELLIEKLNRGFAQLDVNGNGQIDRDDVLGLGSRILLGFGESPTSAKGIQVLDSYDALWEQLTAHADADGDGVISPQEYRDGMTGAFVHGDKLDSVFQPAAEAVMRIADTDGDGTIDREEFETLLRAFGTDGADIDAAFAALDTDGSGQLTVDEMVAAAREYFTSEDPAAPGNLLFGQL